MSGLKEVMKAANFAAVKHTKQRRQDGKDTPYINHPVGVANILSEEGDVDDPVVLQSALLHDTVEDTETMLEEIEKNFGTKIRGIVDEVSDDKDLPKAERKRLQIEHAKHSSKEAKLVKLADKIHNLRDLETTTPVGWSEERVQEYFAWSYKVCENLKGTNEKLEDILQDIFKRNNVEAMRLEKE